MSDSIIKIKSEALAVRIIKLWKYLSNEKSEYIMSKQILRSGTSVSANVNEGLQGESKEDFVHKLKIALKEVSETKHWLRLLHHSDFLTDREFNSIYADATEVEKILTAIIKTTKTNIEKQKEAKKKRKFDL